ncbi:MAG: hypothetical protein K6F62_05230 [Schwartzia sp.]|nr:hypothetical protein [Schwartzia sp. (in: firmicutes)]
MLKLKKIIAGALISASLSAPLPAYAAEAAAAESGPAAVETTAEELDAASYLKLAQTKNANVPNKSIDMTFNVDAALGNAHMNLKTNYLFSSPVKPTKEGLRSKLVDAKTIEQKSLALKDKPNTNLKEILGDNIIFMEGTLNFSIHALPIMNQDTKSHYYAKIDKDSYDRYSYDEKTKKWIHQQIKMTELQGSMGKMEKMLTSQAANVDFLSTLINPVVEDAPSTDDIRSVIVKTNLNDVWAVISKMSEKVPPFEIDDPEAATLSIQVDIDRKTMNIIGESGDVTNTLRYVAHKFLDKAKNMNEMQRQIFGSMIDTATAKFNIQFSDTDAPKEILIPKAAINAPAVPFFEKKKDAENKTKKDTPVSETKEAGK